jgi:membrane glycosyltransferase
MTDAIHTMARFDARVEEERLLGRRLLVVALNAGSWLGLALAMVRLIGSGGWSLLHLAVLILFLSGLPWTLMAFWNAVIGFVILRLARDPAGYTNPALRATPLDSPITARTAICLAVRHEDVARSFARLEAMIESLEATPWCHRFAIHVLSDSSRSEITAGEERAFARLQMRYPRAAFLHYRRRAANVGFKAGNLREFAERALGIYDHMIVLDADSLMSAAAMLRLVRVMQANPMLGILQTLVVGQPSASAFARIFQFGMRHGMRTHTTGIAWWQGSSGPYWGHNAIIRIEPFVAHCGLPTLPGRPPLGGPVLSHDQVEAVLMRAAGYEVRVIADEFESWEENPPSLPDFIKRDLRWCQGNIQYVALLARPGLKPMGRFQLVNAVMMYLGAPFWFLMLFAGLGAALVGGGGIPSPVPGHLGFVLYFGMLAIGFAPRLLGVLDILVRRTGRTRYGGGLRLLAGAFLDALFTLLTGTLMMIAQALFVFGLVFGRLVVWEAQNRDGRRLSVWEAARGLWPQMAFGALFACALGLLAPGAIPWAAPTLVACALAVPFACATASERLGRWMVRHHLCAIPDEFAPAPVIGRTNALARAGAEADARAELLALVLIALRRGRPGRGGHVLEQAGEPGNTPLEQKGTEFGRGRSGIADDPVGA